MRPVFQKFRSKEKSDCLRACVASIMEFECDDVPNFARWERKVYASLRQTQTATEWEMPVTTAEPSRTRPPQLLAISQREASRTMTSTASATSATETSTRATSSTSPTSSGSSKRSAKASQTAHAPTPLGTPLDPAPPYDLTVEGSVINVSDLLALISDKVFGRSVAELGCAPDDGGVVQCPLP